MEAFQKFDWDNNESFQEHLRSVEIPASNPGLIEKVKRRWYAKFVDPTFEDASSPSSSRPSASSRPAGSGATSAPPPGRGSSAASVNVEEAWLWLNVASVACAALYLLGFLFLPFASTFYSLAMYAQLGVWGISLYRAVGVPTLTAEFAMRAFSNDAAHYLLYSLIFAFHVPSIPVLVPVITYSAFNGIARLGPRYPQAAQLASLAARYQQQALFFAVQAEVMLLPLLVVSVFMGSASLISVLGLWQFLKFRYMFNATTRTVVSALVHQLERAIDNWAPSIAPTFQKIKGFLTVEVPPQQDVGRRN